jgi:hypothetical protein
VERPRLDEQESLLQAGAKLAEREAIGLASSLYHDPDDVQARFKLIGFYIEKMYSEGRVDPVLFDQLQWLIRRCPDLPLFSSVAGAYGVLDRDQLLSMFKTLLELEPHELWPVPINAEILLDSMTAAKVFRMNEAEAFYRRLYSTGDWPPTRPEPESTSET